MSALSDMLNLPATVEGLTALGPDKFVVRFDFTHNAVTFRPILTREDCEKLRALLAESLRATQDSVTDPAMLARVVPRI